MDGHKDIGEETPAKLLDDGFLQSLARAYAREHAALGQADAIRHRLQGDGFQPFGGTQGQFPAPTMAVRVISDFSGFWRPWIKY